MSKLALILIFVILIAGPVAAQPVPDSAFFWAGGYFDSSYTWHDTIYAAPGGWFDVPIYFWGSEDTWIMDLVLPLGARRSVIDSFDIEHSSYDFWPFNVPNADWYISEFHFYNDDVVDSGEYHANPPGYHSLSFWGIGWNPNNLWLHSEAIIQILNFRVHAVDSDSLYGLTLSDALRMGADPWYGPTCPVDTFDQGLYYTESFYSSLKFIGKYGYLPGDVNMYNGAWPPAVSGSDVTYLVNYFRGSPANPPCLLESFFCAADINGDCRVIGSDVTRLVSYFRSQASLNYCPQYPTLWESPLDLPTEPPPGWPNCE